MPSLEELQAQKEVEDTAAEVLRAQLPESCRGCPTQGVYAMSFRIMRAVEAGELPLEQVSSTAEKIAAYVTKTCTHQAEPTSDPNPTASRCIYGK